MVYGLQEVRMVLNNLTSYVSPSKTSWTFFFTRLLYIQNMGGLHLSSLAVSEMIHGGVPCALYHYEERSIPHS